MWSYDFTNLLEIFCNLRKGKMKISLKLTAVMLLIGLLAGCAGPNQRVSNETLLCTAFGALAGGAAGAVVSDDAAAVGGAVVGAALAMILCAEDEAVAEPMAVAAVCTETPPPGALLDAQGCAFDSDGDGVVDGVDLCAGTPAGVTVDRVGCPLDTDKDGVADFEDQCPATPLGVIVDKTGCPIAGEVIFSLPGINFEFNSAKLTKEAKRRLVGGIDSVRNLEGSIAVSVEGHTDSVGSEEYNEALSLRRAQTVVDYLVSQGANGNRLSAVGMGELHPVANNDTDAGRAANRRVDFVIEQNK
jgi:OmpA-OmpF porin, OOP family